MTSCRYNNWNTECEDAVNKQIQVEYWASYQYHLMWSYFDRSNVGLKNIAEFFKKSSEEEREHAQHFGPNMNHTQVNIYEDCILYLIAGQWLTIPHRRQKSAASSGAPSLRSP